MPEEHLEVVCDGCGQRAGAQHIRRRLDRLEGTTRFRPIHINAYFLGETSPAAAAEFLYAREGPFRGEAARILEAAGIGTEGKSRETVQSEFQRRGFFLSHLLECPLADDVPEAPAALLEARFRPALTRIRHSLRPKRIVVLGTRLAPFLALLREHGLGDRLLLDGGAPYDLSGRAGEAAAARLGAAL